MEQIFRTDLNGMLAFARVVQTGFTTAAADLGMPKSIVSRKLTELETRIGVGGAARVDIGGLRRKTGRARNEAPLARRRTRRAHASAPDGPLPVEQRRVVDLDGGRGRAR